MGVGPLSLKSTSYSVCYCINVIFGINYLQVCSAEELLLLFAAVAVMTTVTSYLFGKVNRRDVVLALRQ